MKPYLTREQFDELRPRIEEGGVRMRVSKSIARQFFLRVENTSVRETTGESLQLEKALIWLILVTSIVLMLAALYFIVVDFGWGAAVAVPLVGIFWTVVAGFTSERGDWRHGAIGLALALGLAWIVPAAYGIPLALIAISLVLLRSAYDLAQHWVEDLVGRSFPAYDMLVDHVDVEGEQFESSDVAPT